MIKKMLFVTVALFSVFQVIAKTTPGQHLIGDDPLSWNVDIYEEMKATIPSIASREVYYTKVENHAFFGFKDSAEYKSTDKTIEVIRGSQSKATFRPEGHLAKPGDIVNLSYNQKLQVYVPYANKIVTFFADKKKKGIATSLEDAPQDARLKLITEVKKEIPFKTVKPNSKAKTEDSESAQ